MQNNDVQDSWSEHQAVLLFHQIKNKAEDGGGWDQGHRSRGDESRADLEYICEVRVTRFRSKCGRRWLGRGRDQD